MSRVVLASWALNLLITTKAQLSGTITTVAGNGLYDYSGDGGAGTSASFASPYGVALDGRAENVFIADTWSNHIRRLAVATGIVTSVAGNGVYGYGGDGGAGMSASLSSPTGVAVHASGTVFIADKGNHRIRRLDATTGIITTVAGDGSFGYGGDDGPGTSANLYFPSGVAVDAAGNLFIADSSNNRIRRLSAETGIITTVAGNGVQGYSGDGGDGTNARLWNPFSVALDAAGNVFIADAYNNRIRRLAAGTGIITTVAGNYGIGFSGEGGAGTSASLRNPFGVAVDTAGNVIIADSGNNRIRRLSAATGIISTVAGTGVAGYSGDGGAGVNATLNNPSGLAVDAAGSLFIADANNNRIRRFIMPPLPSPMGTTTATVSSSQTASSTCSPRPTRSPTASPPLCRGLPNVVALTGISGVAPALSTATSGITGMYTSGNCTRGFASFFPGPRLVYAIFLDASAPLGGTLTVTTCGQTRNNTVMYVGTGCPTGSAPFGCIAGNDDATTGTCSSNALASTITLTVTQRSYYVQLGGWGGGNVTSGLQWSFAAPSASRTVTPTRTRVVATTRSPSATRSRTRKVKRV